MTRHLKACLEKHAADDGKQVHMFHISVHSRYLPMYWLHVEIPGAQTLEVLDSFLRRLWVECCGHLSCFTIGDRRYSVYPLDNPIFGRPEKSMNHRIYNVLDSGTEFGYEYDYGSTTELTLRVAGVRKASVKKPQLTLLARNHPPAWECVKCGKPATLIEAQGWGLDTDALYCDACAEDEAEDMFLPVVNSPRMGVCGYTGAS